MTYAKATLATLKQSLADRHDGGVLPTSSAILTFWTRLINRGVEYCADRLRLEKSKDYTTSGGTVALDSDFLIVNNVYNGDVLMYQVDKDRKEDQISGTYWITSNHTDGFSLNTYEDDTYTVYYSFKPSSLSGDSDVCIIPDPEAVVAYAYGMLRKSETDPIEDADSALQECDSRLLEIQSAQNLNNNFTGFTW